MKACCATCASRRRASSRSPWWRRWSHRKKTSWKRRKRETSRQDLPRVRIRRACARLQGRPDLEPLPHRARQDSAQSVVGNVFAAPAAARDGDQARAAARLDSVHQGSHRINTKPSWWRLLLALVAFVFWAPASLVGLPCAALLILAPASDPPSGGGWSQPIAGILGAVSVALLVIGGGGGGGRLAAVTSAYIVLTTAAFVSLVLLRPDAILRQALRSVVAAGVACALLIQVMWGSEAWRGLAWEATRHANDCGSGARRVPDLRADGAVHEPDLARDAGAADARGPRARLAVARADRDGRERSACPAHAVQGLQHRRRLGVGHYRLVGRADSARLERAAHRGDKRGARRRHALRPARRDLRRGVRRLGRRAGAHGGRSGGTGRPALIRAPRALHPRDHRYVVPVPPPAGRGEGQAAVQYNLRVERWRSFCGKTYNIWARSAKS